MTLLKLRPPKKRDHSRRRSSRPTRAGHRGHITYSDIPPEESSSETEAQYPKRKRASTGSSAPSKRTALPRARQRDPSSSSSESKVRRSGRNVRSRNMQEVGEDDIPEQAKFTRAVAKYVGAQEYFKPLPMGDDFRDRHCPICDTCNQIGDSAEKGILVYCQGCTMSYHQKCLGPRNTREHLVTKIGDKDFVLQCKRCIGFATQKGSTAPDQGLCTECHDNGASTSPFRDRKTSKEEQKERDSNDGQDPIAEVDPERINNPKTVLFRCLTCYRGCHLHHLPARDPGNMDEDLDEEELGSRRFQEHSSQVNWVCKDCASAPAQIETLVAWRPIDVDQYPPGLSTEMVAADTQEFLIKWKGLSYLDATWMPGNWVWGCTATTMRSAFAKRNNGNNLPIMTSEEAIPEDFLRTDIVFDVEYTNVVKQATEAVAKARIKEVKKALIKFKGLGYEDVVWMEPPRPDQAERRLDFQIAYDDWVTGSFIHPPPKRDLEARLANLRAGKAEKFESEIVLSKQPETLTGGELMPYQLEGLNWIYYQWFKQNNAILADEMGLGKTIQVIGFMAALKQTHICWPFLVVVPNSTCPNWRREVKQWAPSLRVVMYYGSAASKKLSKEHELFPGGDKKLACHVVITSYDAAQEEGFRHVFRGVNWAGLVVDEGQRLKSDKNLLYGSLNALKAPFKLLLTGTPLQNNARELFNLLQFLDPSVNAEDMEREYSTLTAENIARLHTRLRKIFLRRTKAEVLKFLPSMTQIILPVTMSVLQKKLYKSIISQNPELVKAIFDRSQSLGVKERANLNNILMQLRKCLSHPFVYNSSVEDRTTNPTQSHRKLVEASSKLQLLEIMLPKLQENGHRVLIFSQFLNMLDIIEDFLDGLGLFHERLDGSMSSLKKQKKIDAFNKPGSNLFAFLLSTRAGGVGINLATADTVIILDPDFNPHQDIQALSRAHRIGQEKKVLVFQMMTCASAEEKVMQIGKKKLALDHIMIEQMGVDDDAGVDLESILKHGTEALFKDDNTQDIKYDSASVDRLLDRSQAEDTQTDNNKTAESQFSFARVWANDKNNLEKLNVSEDAGPDPSVWEGILKEREREAAEAARLKAEDLGRGRRKRQVSQCIQYHGSELTFQTVDYTRDLNDMASPPAGKKSKGHVQDADSDTDFMERGETSEDAVDSTEEAEGQHVSAEPTPPPHRARSSISQQTPIQRKDNTGSRVHPNTGPIFQRAPPWSRPNNMSRATPQYPGHVAAYPGYPYAPPANMMPNPYEGNPFVSLKNNPAAGRGHYYPPYAGMPPNNDTTFGGGHYYPHPHDPVMSPNTSNNNRPPKSNNRSPPEVIQIDGANDGGTYCVACDSVHNQGYCPLKLAGPEYCNLCGLAHYGHARTCPHVNSVTMLRQMLEDLKSSTEPQELKDLAKKKVLGIIGDLNQRKRKAAEAEAKKKALTDTQDPSSGPKDHQYSTVGAGEDSGKENRTFRPNDYMVSQSTSHGQTNGQTNHSDNSNSSPLHVYAKGHLIGNRTSTG